MQRCAAALSRSVRASTTRSLTQQSVFGSVNPVASVGVSALNSFQCSRYSAPADSGVPADSYTYDPNSVGGYDEWKNVAHGDPSRRAFTYLMLGGTRVMYASAARLAALKFVMTMSASADVLALSTVEVKISEIAPGKAVTIKWRGKPVFIRHRLDPEIESAAGVSMNSLRDPEEDSVRHAADKPNWLVLLGVCTHLGCVPIGEAGDYKGWFCPCHGSHYDTSGRIRKGPAPLNLEIPEYKFLDEETLLIG